MHSETLIIAALIVSLALVGAAAAIRRQWRRSAIPSPGRDHQMERRRADQLLEMQKETLEYESIRYGPPRDGHPLSDGVPDNKKTTVYPIKLKFVHTTVYPKENVTKKEMVECLIVAFKDDLGDWTWKLKENKVEAKN